MARFSKKMIHKDCMKLLKNTLLLLPFIAISLPSYGNTFTAKRAGQGFTGLTQDLTSSLSNPALLTKFDNYDEVFLSINLAIMASDEYDLRGVTPDISDDIDDLADDINALSSQVFNSITQAENYSDELNQQADDIITDLEKIDEKIVKIRNGLNLQIIIPNKTLSFGFFTNQYARINSAIDYSVGDNAIFTDAILSGHLELNDLKSASLAVGYSIAEAGVMAAYPIIKHENYNLSVGVKVKYQRIDLYYHNILISEFDHDDFEITDDENITDKSGANIDLGFYFNWGTERQWHAALVVNNLIAQTVNQLEYDISFNLDTSATLGLSYQNDWLSLTTEIDLTDREQFSSLAASKYLGIGAEFSLYQHMQFRLGYRADLNKVDDNVYTVGLGISPWNVFIIDIAAFTGDHDTLGAALQLSLKI